MRRSLTCSIRASRISSPAAVRELGLPCRHARAAARHSTGSCSKGRRAGAACCCSSTRRRSCRSRRSRSCASLEPRDDDREAAPDRAVGAAGARRAARPPALRQLRSGIGVRCRLDSLSDPARDYVRDRLRDRRGRRDGICSRRGAAGAPRALARRAAPGQPARGARLLAAMLTARGVSNACTWTKKPAEPARAARPRGRAPPRWRGPPKKVRSSAILKALRRLEEEKARPARAAPAARADRARADRSVRAGPAGSPLPASRSCSAAATGAPYLGAVRKLEDATRPGWSWRRAAAPAPHRCPRRPALPRPCAGARHGSAAISVSPPT